MNKSLMTDKQRRVIQRLFKMGKTYHTVATDAGIEDRPDKFDDLSYEMARQIIRVHNGLLGLNR